jgi:hypothetical protein
MAEPWRSRTPCPRCAELERRVAELEARAVQDQILLAKLDGRVKELERLLLEATRASRRRAAPFSRNKPKEKPKKSPVVRRVTRRHCVRRRRRARSAKSSTFRWTIVPVAAGRSKTCRRTNKSSPIFRPFNRSAKNMSRTAGGVAVVVGGCARDMRSRLPTPPAQPGTRSAATPWRSRRR